MLCKNLKIYLQGSNTQSRANKDWHQISYEKKFQFHDDAMQNQKKSLVTYMEKKDVFCGKFKNSRKNLFNEVTGHREYTRNSFASVLATKLWMYKSSKLGRKFLANNFLIVVVFEQWIKKFPLWRKL